MDLIEASTAPVNILPAGPKGLQRIQLGAAVVEGSRDELLEFVASFGLAVLSTDPTDDRGRAAVGACAGVVGDKMLAQAQVRGYTFV